MLELHELGSSESIVGHRKESKKDHCVGTDIMLFMELYEMFLHMCMC